ncbi:MAG: hypothetical protein KGS46_17085 [Chloroflexi bacterium]|nr:hypothetical protein [Chloroflexota bacterium]
MPKSLAQGCYGVALPPHNNPERVILAKSCFKKQCLKGHIVPITPNCILYPMPTPRRPDSHHNHARELIRHFAPPEVIGLLNLASSNTCRPASWMTNSSNILPISPFAPTP